MLSEISESEIYNSTLALQNFQTRKYGYAGNVNASTWILNELSNMTRLTVEYQGTYNNVIATLKGWNQTANFFIMVGAHYDSTSSDPNNAPGCTDNGGGCGIVLELARIMAQYWFNYTVKFAFWNYEEGGLHGSSDYVAYAKANHLNISLYFNYDSTCYDPDDRFILDIMYNNQSQWVSDRMTTYNSLYSIGFNLTYNVHSSCSSDHVPFRSNGYTTIFTHEETHGPSHTIYDTIDKVSTAYARKNAQMGLAVLADLAEVQKSAADINGDGIVDALDLRDLGENFQTSDLNSDLNMDGVVDVEDLKILRCRFGNA